MAATREARGRDGAGAGLETDVLVLLPVPAGHGALHAGALGADCVQYPARAAGAGPGRGAGARAASSRAQGLAGAGRREGGEAAPRELRARTRLFAAGARGRGLGAEGGAPAVGGWGTRTLEI